MDDFDVEAYITKVRGRLGSAAEQRESIREATLAPLGPIQEEIATAQERLRQIRATLRAEKDRALSDLASEAQRRRTEASERAAKILEQADIEAKRVRREAKQLNDDERERVAKECDDKLAEQSRELEEQIAELQHKESEALTEFSGELDDADEKYRDEYEKVLGERILTRKALAGLGFTAPRHRKRPSETVSDELKVAQ